MASFPHRGALAALALPILLASCANTYRWYMPRERVISESPEGTPAAIYALPEHGLERGQLKIWSRGGWIDGDSGRIHVGVILLPNDGSTMRLEFPVELRMTAIDGQVMEWLTPSSVDGEVETAEGSRQRIELWFDTPEDLAPRDIASLDLSFAVSVDDEPPWHQLTPLIAHRLESWYDWYTNTQFWTDS